MTTFEPDEPHPGEHPDPTRCTHPRVVAVASFTRLDPTWQCRACGTERATGQPLPWPTVTNSPIPTTLARGGQPSDRIRTALTRIATLWDATLDPPRTTESHTRTTYGPRLPGNTQALAVRVATTRDLTVIAWHLRTRLNLHAVIPGHDVHQLTDLIDTHADSLAILDTTAVHVLEGHARGLDELIAQTRPSRIRVADCPRCDTGVLYAALRPEDPEQLGNVVACDNHDQVPDPEGGLRPVCGASWTSFEWRACWREVRRIHGASGRRGGKPTRWDGWHPGAVARLAAALGVPTRTRGQRAPLNTPTLRRANRA